MQYRILFPRHFITNLTNTEVATSFTMDSKAKENKIWPQANSSQSAFVTFPCKDSINKSNLFKSCVVKTNDAMRKPSETSRNPKNAPCARFV